MKYKCLSKEKYSFNSYSLITIRNQDIFRIKDWRNEQIIILRQNLLLTDEDQISYFNRYVFPLLQQIHPRQILFSYLKDEKLIGYGGLTNIDWLSKRAEVSFLLDNKRTKNYQLYKEEFKIFLILIKLIAFEDLRFNRLFTETYDIRSYHISTLEESNFSYEGRLRKHVLIDGKLVDSVLHGCLRENGERDKIV